ncbi:GNAT family N-acetyltransferase [Nocardia acidivorans]|uniref:GNAT family N-acetyltransferase n=1 Tax=Nocardia acidivorans TaxID=404580 RepID=UPI00082B151D|nr:GNAT family N-acetyltransferase [Nocardia acidivorans]
MTSVTIRKARGSDDTALADLYRHTWSPQSEIVPRPPRGSSFFGEAGSPEHYLVAELDSEVVGYLRLVQPIPVPSAAHVRTIQGLAVAQSARGRGVGRALLDQAVLETKSQGGTRLTLRAGNGGPRGICPIPLGDPCLAA